MGEYGFEMKKKKKLFFFLSHSPFSPHPSPDQNINPVPGFMRDKGWLHIRFVADNPGSWLFHCHTQWHVYFGQALVFVVAPEKIPAEPRGMPKCPDECAASIATWNQDYVNKVWGGTDYDIGPVANRSGEARGG